MLPLRHAAALAVAIAIASVALALHEAGVRPGRIYEQAAQRAESYGLHGYATAFHLRAAARYGAAASRAAELNPAASRAATQTAADNLLSAAHILQRLSRPAQAEAVLRQASRIAPSHADVRAELLAAQINRGDRLAARRVYDLAHRQDDPRAQLIMAGVYFASDRTDDAVGCLRHALVQLPEDFSVHVALARHALDVQAPAEAGVHARAADRAARDLAERIETADLLRQAGIEAPTRFGIIVRHWRAAYATTLLIALAYVLVLVSPWLLLRARGAGRRVRDWHEKLRPVEE